MDLIEEQRRIEARMSSLGVERFYRQAMTSRQDGRATLGKTVQTVLDATLAPLADAIREFRDAASSGRAGRRHSAIRKFAGLDPSEIAFITARMVLDGLEREVPMTLLSVRIGRKIELEQRIRAFAAANREQFAKTTKFLDGQTSHQGHRERVYMAMLRFGDGDGWHSWTDRDCALIGIKLLELMATSTGLISINQERHGKKTVAVVAATERFKVWLEQLDKQASLLSPEMQPCVVPPKPWTGISGGGYWTNAIGSPLDLVKTNRKVHRAVLEKADLSVVMEAVNAIQETPWQVNAPVLDVARHARSLGYEVAGLPAGDDEALPPKPLDIACNEEARTQWKRRAAKVYQHNAGLYSKRVQVAKTLSIAEEFSKYDRIYFPHQLDFRGRVYSVPQVLNPQGTDLAKGLLRFAEGDSIRTAAGRDWFCIHGANCFGVDKVSFRDRLGWVERNHAAILRTASDPYDDRWWCGADSPFCFLAWCFEYARYTEEPAAFTSHLPIALDGSCNGLQHYSAMLRDPVGGKATNLVPCDEPQDIYGEVAKVVVDSLYRTAMQEHAQGLEYADPETFKGIMKDAGLANAWGAFGIDRKITKRPVMVLPYGGTQSSCQKYVYEVAHALIAEGRPAPCPDDELFGASAWLGTVVWSSIGEVVVAARLAMGWLRMVAAAVAKENLPLTWTTPSGFPVVQAYAASSKLRIKTALFGERFDPALTVLDPSTVDRHRQVNGVAPNFVHSLDAAALILTVIEAKRRGVAKFAMIHDSYGTTAANTATLGESLREVFVRMYENNDMLANFAHDVVPPHLADDLPEPPTVGGLDLNLVRQSRYFFA